MKQIEYYCQYTKCRKCYPEKHGWIIWRGIRLCSGTCLSNLQSDYPNIYKEKSYQNISHGELMMMLKAMRNKLKEVDEKIVFLENYLNFTHTNSHFNSIDS